MRLDARGAAWGRVSCSTGVVLAAAAGVYFGVDGVTSCCLLAALLHELGHLAACILLGVPIRGLRLTLAGAELTLDGRSESGREELVIALGGPLVNLVSAGTAVHAGEDGMLFAGASLLLGMFNLLPIRPLDGSRILHGGLSLADLPLADRVTERVTAVGQLLLLVPGGCFAWMGNPWLLLLTVWMMVGNAKAPSRAAGFLPSAPK